MSNDMRQHSRSEFGDAPTLPVINAGSFQRIADAVEIMAKSRVDLERDRDYWKRLYDYEVARRQRIERSLSATKGQVTKLRNAAKGQPC